MTGIRYQAVNRRSIIAIVLAAAACGALRGGASAAPRIEHWKAVSTTAEAITGDAVYAPTRLSFAGGKALGIAFLHDAPASVSFSGDTAHLPVRLYRVTTHADLVLLNGNRLCGAVPTYVAVQHQPNSPLEAIVLLSVFSGKHEPRGTAQDKLCAGYSYVTSRR